MYKLLKIRNFITAFFCLVFVICLSTSAKATDNNFRTVTDSRGILIKVPREIKRVVTISDGLIEETMTVLGVQDTLVGVGSSCIQRSFKYTFPAKNTKEFNYKSGMNPVLCLNPAIVSLPCIATSGTAPNYEVIAGLNPDVMIIRVGSCWHFQDDDRIPKAVSVIESLGIPLIVLHSPGTYNKPDMTVISDEIRIIGRVFGNESTANDLADYLESQVKLVEERTRNIPSEKKPRILIFGLSPRSRAAGGAGTVSGIGTTESYFVENIVHSINAFQEPGHFKTVGMEQLLALDPDVIVLPTAFGYHPPRELYEAPYYQNLQELKAVKSRRVSALPWSPCNCSKRLEYPIDVMVIAKAAYPELFKDIDLAEWLISFYQNVYGVDREMAKKLRSSQWMDWTLENG